MSLRTDFLYVAANLIADVSQADDRKKIVSIEKWRHEFDIRKFFKLLIKIGFYVA